jgi:hypothetical protein
VQVNSTAGASGRDGLVIGAAILLVAMMLVKFAVVFLLPLPQQARRVFQAPDEGQMPYMLLVGELADTALIGRQIGVSPAELAEFRLRVLEPTRPGHVGSPDLSSLLTSLGHSPPALITLDQHHRILRIEALEKR